MNKKTTTMVLGVAAVGVAAYLIWKNNQKPKAFMNLAAGGVKCGTKTCPKGHSCWKINDRYECRESYGGVLHSSAL